MKERKKDEDISVPFPKEQGDQAVMGDIKINHSVVAGIVRLAAQEVEGVHSVGGGFVEGLTGMFSQKNSERGVQVSENEVGDYVIEVRVNLLFGYELAAVGARVQQNVAKQVTRMTMKAVDRVDVVIDGVRSVKTPTNHSEEPIANA